MMTNAEHSDLAAAPKHTDGDMGSHDQHADNGVSGSGHDRHEGHTPAMFRDRLAISIALTIPILYFSPQIQDWFGYEAVSFAGSGWVNPVLGTALYAYGGRPFLKGALREFRVKTPGMMTLISVAITVAYVYSIAVSLGFSGEPFYWELATLIDVMLLGHWIEMRSVQSASAALDELAKLVPDQAHRIDAEGRISDVAIADLGNGDKVLIRPAEQVPIDGDVVEGRSAVNEAFLTGESRPVDKQPGTEVVAGSINGEGALTIVVTRTGAETTLSQIMRLVADAQASRSRFQVLADRAAFWLTIIAIGVAVPTFAVWLAIGSGINVAITRAVTVLVIACPHALGLAIPLVTANATSMAARNGVLVRNREAFERGRDISVVAMDKTGTLTEGKFGVSSVIAEGISRNEALALAAALERSSEHPVAAAIVAAAEADDVAIPTASEVAAVPGSGLVGRVEDVEYRIGRPSWAAEGLTSGPLGVALDSADERGESAVVLAGPDGSLAVLGLADRVRSSAAGAIELLREMGMTPVMITGDAEAVAKAVAKQLGIDEYYARVLPAEKAALVAKLRADHRVAFVGDGINDAPALLEADLGVAIGAGTNVAIESADLVLVDDDPAGVAKALELSRLTRTKMVQNLGWATGYNVVAVPLAAGVGASFGILLSPAVGAIFMSLSTVIVAINAMAMRRVTLTSPPRSNV